MEQNIIEFPIGDFSDDGHGHCEYYYCTTPKTLNEVRETHFQLKEEFGVSIGDFCREYDSYQIPGKPVENLRTMGFPIDDWVSFSDGMCCFFDPCKMSDELYRKNMPDDSGKHWDNPMFEMFVLWTHILNFVNPDLKLKWYDIKKGVQSINFYGTDEKGRHLRVPGYGLFCG